MAFILLASTKRSQLWMISCIVDWTQGELVAKIYCIPLNRRHSCEGILIERLIFEALSPYVGEVSNVTVNLEVL
jgi:hypothetical protein